MKFFIVAAVLLVSIPIEYSRAQVSVYLPGLEETDSLLDDNGEFIKPINDTSFDIYNIRNKRNYTGFADILKYENDFQVFDHFLFGRPRYVAQLNMFPHQSNFLKNNIILNQPANGLFNTRFLSPDQIEGLNFGANHFTAAHNTLLVHPFTPQINEPYTKVRFYEGDIRFSDLDILFMREIVDGVQLKLGGFNRGYPGSNNQANSVMYDTHLKIMLSPTITSVISWERNHDRSTLFQQHIDTSSFRNEGDLTKTSIRVLFNEDSSSADQLELGVVSTENSHVNHWPNTFMASQRSDDLTLYATRSFNFPAHNLYATISASNNFFRGNSFPDKNFISYFFNVFDQWLYSTETYFEASAEIKSAMDFDPVVNGALSWNWLATGDLFSKAEVSYYNRFPNTVEHLISYRTYLGNKNLSTEKHLEISFLQKWQLLDFLYLKGELGRHQVQDEITFNNNTFININERSWSYLSGESGLKIWNFYLSGGGRLIDAEKYISAKKSLWSTLAYHGPLFGGIIVLDISAYLRWYSEQDRINYNPFINRFYRIDGQNEGYMISGFKIVGTVSSAEIFLEMDNLEKALIEQIYDYSDHFRAVRFGVNWVLLD